MEDKYWFLYDLNTGEIIQRMLYPFWTNIPDGCGLIGPIDQTDSLATDAYNNPNYYLVQEEKLVEASNVADLKLSDAKQAKISELQSASDEATKTFQSSALGSVKTYLADEKSMTFLAGEYAFVKSPDYDNSTTDWFTVEDGTFVTHTGAQIAQVFLDGRAWIKDQKTNKLKSLLAQVEQATDLATVQAITW